VKIITKGFVILWWSVVSFYSVIKLCESFNLSLKSQPFFYVIVFLNRRSRQLVLKILSETQKRKIHVFHSKPFFSLFFYWQRRQYHFCLKWIKSKKSFQFLFAWFCLFFTRFSNKLSLLFVFPSFFYYFIYWVYSISGFWSGGLLINCEF